MCGRSRPSASKESALTPEKVPTPPLAAQAPELSPLEIEMPLPPSTSGKAWRPEITRGISGLTELLLAEARRKHADRRPGAAPGLPRLLVELYREHRKKRK